MQLLQNEPKVKLESIEQNQTLKRSQRLRTHAHFLPLSAFRMRKRWFTQTAFAIPEKKEGEAPQLPQQDPFAMIGMMKQNMAMVIPNMLMMGWVSYFFSGFVLVKLPFSLTDRFKSMLQRGILLNSLNVSYVSSLSWYFLNLFGLRGFFALVLGNESGAIDNPELMAAQMQGGMNQVPDPNQLFQAEKTELEIAKHEFITGMAERRLLAIPIDC